MSRRHDVADATGIIDRWPGYGGLVAGGTTVPTDGSAGFAPGCVFIKVNATAGAACYYLNEGTAASCDFNRLAPVGGAAITTTIAELNLLSGLLATAAEINRNNQRSTRIVNCTASTLAVTEALHDGKIITLNLAAGIAVTLPSAAAGLHFRFIVGTTFTGASSIKSVVGTDIMIGHALMGNDSDNTVVEFQALAASTFDTINLLGTGNSTGGIAGQEIEIIGLATALWFVSIRGDAAGTEATPFENTVT